MSISLIKGPTNTDYDKLDNRMYDLIVDADIYRANKKYIEALRLYKEAGQLGNLYAQRWAGQFYLEGLGVEKNYEKAIRWFRMGVEQNDPISISNVAIMYAEGCGVSQSSEKAIAFFKRASKLGNAFASGQLALIYEFGKGVNVSYEQAVCYYQLALSQGSNDSAFMNNLALCYMEGKGVEKDYHRAATLFRKAIELGNTQAKKNYDIMITKQKQESEQQRAIEARERQKKRERLGIGLCVLFYLSLQFLINGVAIKFFGIIVLIMLAGFMLKVFIDDQEEKKERHESQYYSGIKCYHCGSERVYRMNFDDKRSSIAFWGVASNKIGKTYHCDCCGREW